MWCTRYYARLRSAIKVNNIDNNVLQCLLKGVSSVNVQKYIGETNNLAFANNFSSLTTACRSEERGYVDKSRLNPDNDVTSTNLVEKFQITDYNLIPKIETFEDNLSISDENITLPDVFDYCNEDVSYVGQYQLPSYNIAKFANHSHTLQKLVKLGVELHKFEGETELMKYIISANFDNDLFPYIRFLHDCGVPANYLGQFLSKNLSIFQQDMNDLHTRIRYLRFHNYNIEQIKKILCKHPPWLNYSTKFIDTRLGYFQHTFKLKGREVRYLTSNKPKLITYPTKKVQENTFAIKEEMGFDKIQMKELLLKIPDLWIKSRPRIVDTFDFVHNEMKLSHADIVKDPCILVNRKRRVELRHKFLKKIGRAQYDPTQPLYVSLRNLVTGTDDKFCNEVAKVPIETYDLFLKSM